MATQETINVPAEELVSTAEDTQLVNEEITVSPETEAQQSEEESLFDKSREELTKMLEEIVNSENFFELRNRVNAIKIAFYKRNEVTESTEEPDNSTTEETQSPEEGLFKKLLNQYREKKNAVQAILDKEREENLQKKNEILEKLKNLTSTEETMNATFTRFRALQEEWKSIGQVPQQWVNDIWERYNLHVENFYAYVKINKELRDLDLKKNLEAKTLLCEAAEKLRENPAVIDAFHTLQKLHDEWREIGPVAAEFKEQLWERFKEASSVINRRHQEYFENIKGEQLRNLALKTALCEKAEELVASLENATHKAWSKANDTIAELQKEWRTIGFAPKKDNTKIYERFRAAVDRFFQEKKKFYSEFKEDLNDNLKLKEQLCEAVEKLTESEEWKEATEKIIALQAEWKKVGAVSRKHSDAVWKRFRTACDTFFERKSQHFSSIDSEYKSNLEAKKALLDEIEAMDLKDVTSEVIRNIQKQWNKIGFVPIRNKENIQKRYKDAMDRLFNYIRSAEKSSSIEKFRERVSQVKNSSKLRTEREKLYNRVRALENEIQTLENNIGFFSRSKGAEKLIEDVRANILKARNEMASAIEKINIIDKTNE